MRYLTLTLLTAIAVVFSLSDAATGALVKAYYTFDASDATDSSGEGNNGTPGASVTFSTDVPAALGSGNSAVFDDNLDGLIAVPTSPSLETLKDAMTVAFWIKLDHTQNDNWVRVTRKGTEANPNSGWTLTRQNNTSDLLLRTDTQGAGGGFNQNRGNGVGIGMLDGTWHHYGHVRVNGTWTEYVDGVVTGTGAYPHGTGFANTEPLYVGGRPGQSIEGQLDDYAIWNLDIGAAQMAQLAAGNLSPLLVTPEPSTMVMLLGGIAGLALRRRRRRTG